MPVGPFNWKRRSITLPSDTTRLSRMRACRSDLLANDIALDEADDQGPGGELSRRHLDYFQLMLGHDVVPGELSYRGTQV